jgi:hypothetical protein
MDELAVVLSAASRLLRRQLRPLVWVTLEEVALDAVAEDGRFVARTSARQVADRLGVDPGTAAGALRVLRRKGLLLLEREHGPAGRFGLSVYVLGTVAGLTVLSPRVADPCVAVPSPADADGPRPAGPGVPEPCADQPYMEKSKAGALGPTTVATDWLNAAATAAAAPSLPTPQCPGQKTIDLGSVSG